MLNTLVLMNSGLIAVSSISAIYFVYLLIKMFILKNWKIIFSLLWLISTILLEIQQLTYKIVETLYKPLEAILILWASVQLFWSIVQFLSFYRSFNSYCAILLILSAIPLGFSLMILYDTQLTELTASFIVISTLIFSVWLTYSIRQFRALKEQKGYTIKVVFHFLFVLFIYSSVVLNSVYFIIANINSNTTLLAVSAGLLFVGAVIAIGQLIIIFISRRAK